MSELVSKVLLENALKNITEGPYSFETAPPTALCFEFHENGTILTYNSLNTYGQRSYYDVKKSILENGYEFAEPLNIESYYATKNFDHDNFAAMLEKEAQFFGFPIVRHFAFEGKYFYYVGYHENCILNTAVDLERYCYDAVVEHLDQLEKNYFGKLILKKDGKEVIFNEKIEKLIPYWGEVGLDGFYLNSLADKKKKERDDLDTGYFMRADMSIEDAPISDKVDFYQTDKIIKVLYRVCVKLMETVKNRIVSEDFVCYPCIHDSFEDYNNELMQEARDNINVDTDTFLAI